MDSVLLVFLLTGVGVATVLWLVYRKRGWVFVSPQLETMSVRRMKYLLAGTFFFGAAIAFEMDLSFSGTDGISPNASEAILTFIGMGLLRI
jgi:hypothetical protein